MYPTAVQASSHDDAPTAVVAVACEGAVTAASVAADSSFHTFFADACRVGLAGIVNRYDASALLVFAEQALVLEQKLATGCFLLQAVLLVEHFVRTTTCDASEREWRARDFGQSRKQQSSSSIFASASCRC